MSTDKTYTLKVQSDVKEEFKAKMTTTVQGDTTLEVQSGKIVIKASMQSIEISSGSQIKMKAPMIEIKADSMLTLDGGGMTNVKGGMINLG